MITLQALPTFNLVGNPVNVVATTDNLFPVSAKAELILQVDAIDTLAGHKLTLAWNGKSLEFTSAAVPNGTGLQLPSATPGMTTEAWCALLTEHFEYNYELASDFLITCYFATFWHIRFTAREYGTVYQLVFNTTDFADFLSEYASTTAISKTRREGFKILLQVLQHDDELIIGEDMATPDDSGRVVFDIADYLKSLLHPNLVWPEPSGSTFQVHEDDVQRFFLRYCEYYGGSFYQIRKTTAANCCLLGGLSFEYEGFLQENNSGYFDFNNNNRCFLTWGPKTKLISAAQPEKLYFLLSGTCVIIVDVWFSDNSHEQQRIDCVNTTNAILEIFAGPVQLGFASAYPGKTVTSYRIMLEQDAEIISENRTFTIDAQYYEFERVFVFRNAFGRYDFIRFTGKGKTELEYKRETASVAPAFPRKLSTGSMVETDTQQTQSHSANSGWLDSGMKKLMGDFFLSRERYELIDGKIYPILVKTKKFTVRDDNESLFSADVEYIRASKSINFSSPEFAAMNGNNSNYLYILDSGFWDADRVWGAAMIWNP